MQNKEDKMKTGLYDVKGMTCTACAGAIERGLGKLDGIKEANVNFATEKLKVEYFGDQFARKMYEFKCSPETLIVAEEKMNYLKSINIKQTEIKF